MARQLTPQEKDRLAAEGRWPPGAASEVAPATGTPQVWLWVLAGVIVLIAIAGGAILGFWGGRVYERAQNPPAPVVVVTRLPAEPPAEPPGPGPYQSGRLGISYRMLQPGDPFPVADGALVIRTLDERAPAARAGLKPGDIITQIGDVPVTSWNALEDTLAGFGAGEHVELVVVRAGDVMHVEIELG